MRIHLPLAAGALLLAGTASAQVDMGFLHNWDQPTGGAGTSLTHRGGLPVTMPGDCLNRIDDDDHKFWGLNGAGMTEVDGFSVTLQDENDTTRELFTFVGYNEDPNSANFPDTSSTPAISLGQFQMPPTMNNGPIAWRITATFSFNNLMPAQVAPNQDIFIGFTLPAWPSTMPADGLSIHMVHNDPTSTTHDIPGPTGQQGGSVFMDTYVCFVQGGTPMYLPSMAGGLRQNLTEVLVSGGAPGGVPITQTNQVTYPSSNSPFGTTNFLSGSHPDTFDSNMTGRADNLGFVVTVDTSVIPVGSPVFYIMALGPSPLGPRAMNTFGPASAPGSQGSVVIDFVNGVVFIQTIALTNNPNNPTEGQAVLNISLSQQTRNVIAGWVGPLDLWWQAFVLNPTVAGPPFEIRATGGAVQHLK